MTTIDGSAAPGISVLAAAGDASAAAVAQVITADAKAPLTPSRMADLLAAVGGVVSDDNDLLDVLQRSVEIAHEAIGGATSCGVTVVLDGATYTAVHTDARTLEVDSKQYAAGAGPCLEAARTGRIIRVDVDSAEQKWPEFVSRAKMDGIRSFLAAPIASKNLTLGSFNLYGTDRAAFSEVDEHVIAALATVAARSFADYSRVQTAEKVAEGLRTALAQRAPIEQAKGILMAMHGIDAAAAFDILSKQSQKENRKLRDVAREFVDTASNSDRSNSDR